jgi:putative ABC transport system permease protein
MPDFARLDGVMFDHLRLAIRRHRRQRGYALTVILMLALTVAATAGVFAMVNGTLWRGLPFASADRLMWIASVRTDNPSAPFTLPEFLDYRARTRTLAGLAAYANWSASLAGESGTERFQGARMSANAFDVLGVSPAAGRLLRDSDDRAEAPRVVVISDRLWQQRFGGTADVIGRPVRVNGESFLIVGVMPPHVPLPQLDLDIVTPLVPDRDPLRNARGSTNFLRFVGRLRPGVDADQAAAELTAICRALRQQFPVEYARKEAVTAIPLQEVLVSGARRSMLLLFAAVLVVLATALANLVSLALVRTNGRRTELATRIALGASRIQLTRQLGSEALLLVIAGSGLGWLLALHGIGAARQWPWLAGAIPRIGEVQVDATVALFVIAVSALVTLVLTIAPLTVLARMRADDALRPASRGSIGDRWTHRLRNLMVSAEIAAALVLLLAAAGLLQNLLRLRDVQPGFVPDGVFQARVSLPAATYQSTEEVTRFYERLSERLAALPGVRSVGVISVAPLSGLLLTVPFSVEGQPLERSRPNANLRAISTGYLDTVGTRLLRGRAFSEDDRPNAPAVAMVSAALADRVLGGVGDAVGRRVLISDNNEGPRAVEIVGVVENVRQAALDLPPAFDIYLPLRQIHPDALTQLRNNQFWMVRVGTTDASAAAFRGTFTAQLRATDADAAVSGAGPMRQFLDAALGPRRVNLSLFSTFAGTGVLLAVFGLYGLVSYAMAQRAAEFGLRMAIGATGADVQRLVLGQAARLAVAGVACGLAAAVITMPLIGRLVQDIAPPPLMAGAVAIALIAVVLTAAWVPARRAARIDPTVALRTL